ncbi:MAG: SDR family oxidoreductase [Candidatus Omnitrophica bacterium]|nr:SDR family oxidoreductase [Candidatus Omnitrophota bacterium]
MSLNKLFSLNRKVAIVTGGTGHLGRAISQSLAQAGARVVVAGRNDTKCKQIAAALSKKYKVACTGIIMDISSSDSVKSAMATIHKTMGGIDILVNNAVYCTMSSPERMSDAQWGHGIDGTLTSVFRCVREAIPYLKKKTGTIINIASMYGFISPDFKIYKDNPDFFSPPNYGAAKAGVIQLTKYYAVYLAHYGIRVNCVSPGAFPSAEVRKKKNFIKLLCGKTPQERIGSPEELKGTIIFLASQASSYITGQNIIVDGGWTLW